MFEFAASSQCSSLSMKQHEQRLKYLNSFINGLCVGDDVDEEQGSCIKAPVKFIHVPPFVIVSSSDVAFRKKGLCESGGAN